MSAARRRLLLGMIGRPVLTATALVVVYFLAPLDGWPGPATAAALGVSLLLVAATIGWQLRAIVHSPYPRLRAVGAIALSFVLFIVAFAMTYFLTGRGEPDSFSEPMNRTDALYFTVTVFSTVGFGDITPKSEVARVITMGQMFGDIVLVGVVARLLVKAVDLGLRRRPNDDASDTAADWRWLNQLPSARDGIGFAGATVTAVDAMNSPVTDGSPAGDGGGMRRGRWWLRAGEDPAGIYGLLVSATAMVATADSTTGHVATAVLVTVFAYWAAEQYAKTLAAELTGDRVTAAWLWRSLREGWPMVQASYTPLAVLVVAAVVGQPTRGAVLDALVFTTAVLGWLGWSAGRRGGLRGTRLLLGTLMTGALGVLMIGLKLVLH
jgi:hypothetical protein